MVTDGVNKMQGENRLDLKKLSRLDREGRKAYLEQFRNASRQNKRWYTDFKEAVAARAGVSLAMVSIVLHNPTRSAPVWKAAQDVLEEDK